MRARLASLSPPSHPSPRLSRNICPTAVCACHTFRSAVHRSAVAPAYFQLAERRAIPRPEPSAALCARVYRCIGTRLTEVCTPLVHTSNDCDPALQTRSARLTHPSSLHTLSSHDPVRPANRAALLSPSPRVQSTPAHPLAAFPTCERDLSAPTEVHRTSHRSIRPPRPSFLSRKARPRASPLLGRTGPLLFSRQRSKHRR